MSKGPRYPAPLRPGSRIFVTAPSSGVAEPLWPRLELVLGQLAAQGFVVEEGRCLRAQRQSASAPASERAAELMHAFLRDDVAAVLPPWGGELAIELLEQLDFERLASAAPKWLMGFSDLSTLMLPLLLRAGWASAHGLNLMDLAPAQQDELSAGAQALLRAEPGARVEQRASTHWQREWRDFAQEPASAFQLTEPTRWWALRGQSQLELRGRVLAGCLDTWMHLAGTPYGDVPAWLRQLGGEGCLLFLENSDLPPCDVVRALRQLRYAGWLSGVSALLLGRSGYKPKPEQPANSDALTYEQAVERSLAGLELPVLMDVDCGHVPPQLTLVQGALAELRWAEGQRAVLAQTLA